MKIVNLTQHAATPAQKSAGVADLPAALRVELQELLQFDSLPTSADISSRADALANLAAQAAPYGDMAMIGGAPYLMAPLEWALREKGIQPLYAFSKRESAEQVQPDGSVRKVNVFRHMGFVEAV